MRYNRHAEPVTQSEYGYFVSVHVNFSMLGYARLSDSVCPYCAGSDGFGEIVRSLPTYVDQKAGLECFKENSSL